MKLAEEIRELFANSDKNTAYRINNVSEEYPAWVIRFWDDRFGVAVPYSGVIINENFANASLYSERYNFGGTDIECLFLTSSLEKSRNEFAVFCRDFVYEGTETYAFPMSGKHIINGLYLLSIMNRKDLAFRDAPYYIDGDINKQIYHLSDVRAVPFQCLLLDDIHPVDGLFEAKLYTIYFLK